MSTRVTHSADKEPVLAANGRSLTGDPSAEFPEREGGRESRRTGVVLVIVGVVLMALAATDAAAAGDGAPEATSSGETRLESFS